MPKQPIACRGGALAQDFSKFDLEIYPLDVVGKCSRTHHATERFKYLALVALIADSSLPATATADRLVRFVCQCVCSNRLVLARHRQAGTLIGAESVAGPFANVAYEQH